MNPYEEYIKLYNGKLPTERDPNYLELLRMSKYRILAVPDVAPGKCVNCGSSKEDGRRYIDIGQQVDWFGALFFCGLCIKEIATNMGLFVELENKLREVTLSNTDLSELNENSVRLTDEIARIYEEVKEHFTRLSDAGADIPIDNSTGGNSTETTSESGIDTPESGTKKPEPRTTKPNSSSGRKDVPSLASLLDSP